jgi:hypothetical protein
MFRFPTTRHGPAIRCTVVGALAAVCLSACAEKVIIAETLGAGGRGGIDASALRDAVVTGSARETAPPASGGGGGSGGTDGMGGNGNTGKGILISPPSLPLWVSNDPCDAAGFLDFYAEDHAYAGVTGYVIAFDPPEVLKVIELEKADGGITWQARIDHLDLPGPPDCNSLRGAAAFTIATLRDGAHGIPYSWGAASSFPQETGAYCPYPSGNFYRGTTLITDVRAFGMLLDGATLDGPFQVEWESLADTTTFHASDPDAGLSLCQRPAYLNFLVAHRGSILVGMVLSIRDGT